MLLEYEDLCHLIHSNFFEHKLGFHSTTHIHSHRHTPRTDLPRIARNLHPLHTLNATIADRVHLPISAPPALPTPNLEKNILRQWQSRWWHPHLDLCHYPPPIVALKPLSTATHHSHSRSENKTFSSPLATTIVSRWSRPPPTSPLPHRCPNLNL